jgi:hypothetical protein
MSSYQPADDAA